jgi:putative transposase
MIDRGAELPVKRQCELLDLNRTGVYYTPRPTPEADLRLMRRIDELHLAHPFYGSRRLARQLQLEGFETGRLHVATLMRRMGIEARYRKPRTSAERWCSCKASRNASPAAPSALQKSSPSIVS